MNVLLIYPPFQRLRGLRDVSFPLGLGYLASTLEQVGHTVRIYNAEIPKKGEIPNRTASVLSARDILERHDEFKKALSNDTHHIWREVASVIETHRPDIIGITSRTPVIKAALKIASITKRLNPQCFVVLGGTHPTVRPEECIGYDDVDFVVVGEGERTVKELVECLGAGASDYGEIDGILFKRDGQVVRTKQSGAIADLDTLPFPARHLALDWQRGAYSAENLGEMITSRGCPYQCAFCNVSSIWGRKVRYRSIENVLGEIEHLATEYGVNMFRFEDDTFTSSLKRVERLCGEIVNRRLGIYWHCITRVNILNDGLLEKMKSAGCVHVNVGIESGSQRILDLIHKDITLEQIERAVALLDKHGLAWSAYFMVGIPYETEEDMRKTVELMSRVTASNIVVSIFTPYPGTELYEVTNQMGLMPGELDWSDLTPQSPYTFFVKDVPRERFEAIVQEMLIIVERRQISLHSVLRYGVPRLGYFLRRPRALVKGMTAFVHHYIKVRFRQREKS